MDEWVTKLYAATGCDVANPPGVARLANELFDWPRFDRAEAGAPSSIDRAPSGRWHVALARIDDPRRQAVSLAIEIACWCTADTPRALEWSMYELAGRILLPAQAVRLATRMRGYDVDSIAESIVMPRRMIELRLRQVFPPAQTGSFARLDFAV